MSQVLLSTNESVPFWRPQDIIDINCAIPILVKNSVDQRGKWPGGFFPHWSEIARELSASRAAFLKVKKNKQKRLTFITLLTGRFIISATISVKEQS